jgi:hypothetical protein
MPPFTKNTLFGKIKTYEIVWKCIYCEKKLDKFFKK